MSRRAIVVAVIAACSVRAPSPIDVGALLARRGPVEARRDLQIRILAEPRDVQTRLALADLDDRIGLPGEALDQLDFVYKLSGPLGTRWHDADRARYVKLLQLRIAQRNARHAASALEDVERTRKLGASVSAEAEVAAKFSVAVTLLRHVDAHERARGRDLLKRLPTRPWNTGQDERGELGAWLWSIGARREAYEQLARWYTQDRRGDHPALDAAYRRALAWWSPADLPGPPVSPEPPPEGTPPVEPVADMGDPRATAAIRFARARVPSLAIERLTPIVRAFGRDPAVAERLGRELVAASIDAAEAHAALGALFDALGDPARARAEWQAAVDGSPEPGFVRGLAEACARGGDGPAAGVFATRAAAAWGDPAIVWIAVARALDERGLHVDALQAAHSAMELAGREALPAAIDVAAAASRALGRTVQADALDAQRNRLSGADADARGALAAFQAHPTAAGVAQLWVVSRAHRSVDLLAAMYAAMSPDDPRRATIAAELATLAADPDRGLAAVRALAR